MKRIRTVLTLLIVALPLYSQPCAAQNVSGYGTMSDPFLFLLREPAVQEDLGLSREQQARLVALNESLDGILLATRNMPPAEAQTKVADVTAETQTQVAKLFSAEQQTRLRQIAYRLRGVSFVLLPDAAAQLKLSDQKKEEIEAIVKTKFERLGELQTTTYQGKEAHQKTQAAAAAALQEEQRQILDLLDNDQKQQLMALVGRRFDPASLGRVSFRAPELATGDEWINSEELKLTDLRGKVIALHFWAFG